MAFAAAVESSVAWRLMVVSNASACWLASSDMAVTMAVRFSIRVEILPDASSKRSISRAKLPARPIIASKASSIWLRLSWAVAVIS